MDTTKLIARVKAILTTPKTEWPVIAAEPASVGAIYRGYVVPLAAIPVIAGFLKMTLIGITVPFAGTVRVGMVSGLTQAVVTYALALGGTYVVALIIDALAPQFGGEKNIVQALKAAAYAYTAAWISGIGHLLPIVGMLIVIAGALYSLYLLYLGLPLTMKAPPEKAGVYTAIVVVVALVISLIIGAVVGAIAGVGAGLTGGLGNSSSSSGDLKFDPNSPLGKLAEMGKNAEQASKDYEAAQKSGDTEAQQKAMGQMMGSIFSGGDQVESLPPERLKGFLPETLSGLARTDFSAERNQAMGMQISEASARYSDGNKSLRLEITDMGSAKGLMGLASWASVEQDKETDSGYERTRKEGGRILHEQWDNQSHDGEFTVVLGERFSVKVSGQADSIDQLKSAVGTIDLNGLEALKGEGVKKGG